jgi:hypothetical protein
VTPIPDVTRLRAHSFVASPMGQMAVLLEKNLHAKMVKGKSAVA